MATRKATLRASPPRASPRLTTKRPSAPEQNQLRKKSHEKGGDHGGVRVGPRLGEQAADAGVHDGRRARVEPDPENEDQERSEGQDLAQVQVDRPAWSGLCVPPQATRWSMRSI